MGDPTPKPELVSLEPVTTAVIRGVITWAELREFFDRGFRTLGQTLAEQQIAPRGPAFAFYHSMGETIDVELGFPTEQSVRPDNGVTAGALPGGRVVRMTHLGSYEELGNSWQRLGEWAHEQGLTGKPEFWESYLTQPTPEMDPRELRTELFKPLID